MAARRLIAVMLVLLFLSSLAAALAPVEPQSDDSSTSSTTTETAPGTTLAGGDPVRETLVADPKNPPRIRAAVGDQLQLRVTSKRAATLELVRLGPTEDVDPAAPALFDVLLDRRGTFPIQELETGKVVGRILVSRRARTESGPDQERSRS